MEKKILPSDPFQTIDQDGIGELIKMGISRGRSVKPNLKIGICGEHGGEPESVKFCHAVGMSYVSCSPYRVPLARLAAAQAAIAGLSELKAGAKAPKKAAAKSAAQKKPAAKTLKKASKKTARKAVKKPAKKAAKGKR
jgi:pyruvate,orthophosphate dikinase